MVLEMLDFRWLPAAPKLHLRQKNLVWVSAGMLAAATVGTLGSQTRDSDLTNKLANAALERTHHAVRYDPSYVRIPYPGGDVPANTGVCTDEIIRIYRSIGIDLQREVHDDIVRAPRAYPRAHLPPDTNIDHRRVPNLMIFFQRHGEVLPISPRASDYQPGDVVTWDLGRGVNHIGMVVNQYDTVSRRPVMVHNIGAGPKMEDVLFAWRITGHFRYDGRR